MLMAATTGNMEQVRNALTGITGVAAAPAKDEPDRYMVTVRMNREMDSVDSLRRHQLRSYWPNYEEFAPVRIVAGVRLTRRTRRVGILPGYVFAEVDPGRDFTALLDRVVGAFDVVRTASGAPLLIPDLDIQIIRKIEIGLNTPKLQPTGHGDFKVGNKVRFVDDLLGRWPAGRVIKLAREARISVQVEMMGRKVSITVLPHQIERT
jgi:transcription antitermination factor NusG